MDITEQFSVTRPIESVWSLFQDVPELVRCLPGAELTSDNGDGTYDGGVSVKLGPISASFEGTATIEFDHDAFTLNIKGRGVDRSGGSQGKVDVDVHLVEIDSGRTSVTIEAKVELAGPIAQFGRTGLISEVSRRLIDDFSACIHAKLAAETSEEAAAISSAEVRGLSLFLASIFGAFVGWLKRLFSHSGA
ncbi:MAG: SRPBCC family protein [Actinomycetota bacterium]|nr:SRPBCC family protein [Actinomycetota bacterium]MDK1039532.1 SRPBCC family protein [Actinomycetota bacterium]MDK1104287.1 SRPBCC family protein [Actinomycetota bacterium]MDK1292830.1 SRPBCC family protein [Actinomycetota bacterium]